AAGGGRHAVRPQRGRCVRRVLRARGDPSEPRRLRTGLAGAASLRESYLQSTVTWAVCAPVGRSIETDRVPRAGMTAVGTDGVGICPPPPPVEYSATQRALPSCVPRFVTVALTTVFGAPVEASVAWDTVTPEAMNGPTPELTRSPSTRTRTIPTAMRPN